MKGEAAQSTDKSVCEEVYGVGGAASQLSLHDKAAVFSEGREQRNISALKDRKRRNFQLSVQLLATRGLRWMESWRRKDSFTRKNWADLFLNQNVSHLIQLYPAVRVTSTLFILRKMMSLPDSLK